MTDGTNHLPPGTRFGEYEIVRLIGRGGMNCVYEARHLSLKKRVALKAMLPEVASDPEVLSRFMREGEAAARIRHPHVVDVSDVGVVDGVPFLVMEYLEGEDLCSHIEAVKKIGAERATALMLPVLSAVTAAHDAGVVHRDLKPENIFLTRRRNGELHPKVVDFGISKLVDPNPNAAVTKTMTVMGTPHYMSPEQAVSTKRVDARTDQYSLAVVLYEMVAGQRPYEGDTLYDLLQSIVKGGAPAPSTCEPSIPPELDAIVLKAMARDADSRYPSLLAFGRALLPFADASTRARWAPEFEHVADTSATIAGVSRSEIPPPPVEPRPKPTAGPIRSSEHAADPGGATVASSVQVPSDSVISSARKFGAGPSRAPVWLPFAVIAACGVAIAGAYAIRSAPPPTPTNASPIVTGASSAPAEARPATILPSTYTVSLEVHPSSAAIELDGQPAGTGSLTRDLPRDGTSHQIHVSAPGYEPQTLAFRDSAPPPVVELAIIAPGIADAGAAHPPPAVAAHSESPQPVAESSHSENHASHGSGHAQHGGGSPRSGTNGAMILN